MIAKSENLLVVHPSMRFQTLAELVAAAKARPGTLTFASAGNASPAHMCGEMIMWQTGIDMTHVPFTGSAPAMNAVLAGNVTMFCAPIAQALPHVMAKSVYALGVTGLKPSSLLPDMPLLSTDYPGLIISNWFGLFAPSSTPTAVTGALESQFKKIFSDPELNHRVSRLGLDPEWSSGIDFSQKIATDTAKWRAFIEKANIKLR